MTATVYDIDNLDIAWCPGCGNYSILTMIKQALAELAIPPASLVVACGIGQAPKTPHYYRTNMFNGLHGRALPVATGIKATNPRLTVIAEGGDGDMYGEGGNHFIHTIRRNPNITHLVHDNQVYGLTKGQASPTSEIGFKTTVQTEGVINEPINPMAVAIALDAPFVARAFSGDVPQTKEIVKKAIQFHGYALVDILQPCVTYNKVNTFKWYKEHVYYLDESYTATDRTAAFATALQTDRLALGVLYTNPDRRTFEDGVPGYKDDRTPVAERGDFDRGKLAGLMSIRGRV
jgi:2-oxoglutarate/2-oxoacid ferredoxin oxidoreductase subunit beta